MKHLLYFILAGMLLCSGQPAYAQEKITERVYIHLDKDYYIAGEPVRMKFLALDGNCRPSDLSKVGYVEISGTERPYVQFKLALSAAAVRRWCISRRVCLQAYISCPDIRVI